MAKDPTSSAYRRKPPPLGQHFLVSQSALDRILETAGSDPNGTVLEIGPGTGVLTLPLAKRFGSVIAVERDARLAAALAKTLHTKNIKNVILRVGDIRDLFPHNLPLPNEYAVVANIPYYLTGHLLRVLLDSPKRPRRMVLLVQREVAERITAKPPHMNLLALGVQAYGMAHIVAAVPKTSFSPVPSVDSSIVVLENISDSFFTKAGISPAVFFAVPRMAFAQKRKMLRQSLRKIMPHGFSNHPWGTKRPEELGLSDWVRLSERNQLSS